MLLKIGWYIHSVMHDCYRVQHSCYRVLLIVTWLLLLCFIECWQNPILTLAHTNSVSTHSRKQPAPVADTFSAFRGCPLTRASTVTVIILVQFRSHSVNSWTAVDHPFPNNIIMTMHRSIHSYWDLPTTATSVQWPVNSAQCNQCREVQL